MANMRHDGQTAWNYGIHSVPEAKWSALDECPRCGAMTGHACRDLRYRVPQATKWTAHPGRELLHPLSPVPVFIKLAQTA